MKAIIVKFTDGSYNIKEDLKKEGFSWDKDNKCWVKTYEDKKDFDEFYSKYTNPTWNGRKGARIFSNVSYEIEEVKEPETKEQVEEGIKANSGCVTAARSTTVEGINECFMAINVDDVIEMLDEVEFISCDKVGEDIDIDIWAQELNHDSIMALRHEQEIGHLYVAHFCDEQYNYDILFWSL